MKTVAQSWSHANLANSQYDCVSIRYMYTASFKLYFGIKQTISIHTGTIARGLELRSKPTNQSSHIYLPQIT